MADRYRIYKRLCDPKNIGKECEDCGYRNIHTTSCKSEAVRRWYILGEKLEPETVGELISIAPDMRKAYPPVVDDPEPPKEIRLSDQPLPPTRRERLERWGYPVVTTGFSCAMVWAMFQYA